MSFLAGALTIIAVKISFMGYNRNDLFWFLSNAFVFTATCYPAGELEIQNQNLRIELGALPISRTRSHSNLFLSLYQTCSIKTVNSPFGILVKGTTIRITFNALIRVGSIVLSTIIFLGGVIRAV